jgi:hypothetical protein
MNTFMSVQINNMLQNLRLFEDAMKLAVYKDDGELSKEEAKQLKAIATATDAFRTALLKAKGS